MDRFGCKGGFFAVSCYLHTREGLSERNVDLLHQLAALVTTLDGPWVIGGDFTMPPEVLQSSGWLQLIRGAIVAPPGSTCHDNTYDYFIVRERLLPAVRGVVSIEDAGFSPHSPSRLFLSVGARRLLVRRLVAPRRFPPSLPLGCFPRAHASPACPPPSLVGCSPPQLDAAFDEWLRNLEDIVSGIMGLDGYDKKKKTSSRCLGPRFVMQPALGRPSAGVDCASSTSLSWRKIAAWLLLVLCDLKYTVDGTSCSRHPIRASALRGRNRLFAAMRKPLPSSSPADAAALTSWCSSLSASRLDNAYTVAELHTVAMANARAHERALRRSRIDSWLQWVVGGPARGLRHQHRFTREPTGWIDTRVDTAPPPDDGRPPSVGEREGDGIYVQESRLLRWDVHSAPAPLGQQALVDREADEWALHWQVGVGPPTALPWPTDMGPALPRPTVADIHAAAMKFSADTGLGWDAAHPRVVRRLPDYVVVRLIDILMEAEALGHWPKSVAVTIIALLAKPTGGHRPIGIFQFIVRLWMKLRKEYAQAWERRNEREYFYAGPAKSALRAAWCQSATAESSASYTRLHWAATFLDLIKAFDYVPHGYLIQQAIRRGHSLHLLRLSIAAYRLPRVLMIAQCCSKLVWPSRGITAGAVHATTELRVLIIDFFDSLIILCPTIHWKVYVDDASGDGVASENVLVDSLSQATLELCRCFVDIGMEPSLSKNRCASSCPRVARAIAQRLDKYNFLQAERVVSLGVGLGGGNKRSTFVLSKRLRAFVRRIPRFRKLRRAGVSVGRVLRTGGTAAFTHGQAVCGVSPSMLLQQRRAVAAAEAASGGGKNLDLSLLCGVARDPAIDAHVDTIRAWALAVWDKWLPLALLSSLASDSRVRLTKAARPWSVVHGPGSAFIATASRISWTVHSAWHVTTDIGAELDFRVDPPIVITRAVTQAVHRWRWRNIELAFHALDSGGIGAGALFSPIDKLLQGRRFSENWGPQQVTALKSAIVGGQWTQTRLNIAGFADSPGCRLCEAASRGLLIEPPRGDSFHRSIGCSTLDPYRQLHAPPDVRRAAADLARHCPAHPALPPDAPYSPPPPSPVVHTTLRPPNPSLDPARRLFCERALISECGRVPRPPPSQATFSWHKMLADGVSRGRFYPDGSGIDGEDPSTARFGWAFVQAELIGVFPSAAFGATPFWIDSVVGAEAWALFMAFSHALPGSSARTDCFPNVTALRKGRLWATRQSRALARTYSMIYAQADDDDDLATRVDWMPSHRTDSAVGEQLLGGVTLSITDIRANRLADLLAKKGAATFRVPKAERDTLSHEKNRVEGIAKWIGRVTHLANNWHEYPWRDSDPSSTRPRHLDRGNIRRKLGRRVLAPRPPVLGGHSLLRTCDGWKCTVCRTSATTQSRLSSQRCAGSAALKWACRAQQDALGSAERGGGHIGYMNGPIVWCSRCGCYADRFAVGLAKACNGRPSCDGKAFHLRRMLRGRHPVTGALFTDIAVREPSALGLEPTALPTASPKTPWGSIPSPSTTASAQQPCGPSAADRMRALRARVRHRIASRPVVSTNAHSRERCAVSTPCHSFNPHKKARIEPSTISSALPHRHSWEDAPLLYGASFGSPPQRQFSKREPLLNPLETRFLDDALVHGTVYSSDSDRYVVGGASSSSSLSFLARACDGAQRCRKREAYDVYELIASGHEGNARKRICRGVETTALVTTDREFNGAPVLTELAANSEGPHRMGVSLPIGSTSGAVAAPGNSLVHSIADATLSAVLLQNSLVQLGLDGAAPPTKRLRIRGKSSPC